MNGNDSGTGTYRVLSLLGHLYGAASNPTRWPQFLHALADTFDASAALVTSYDSQHEMATFGTVHNLPPHHLQDLIVRAEEDPRGPYNVGKPWHPGINRTWHPDISTDWVETWDFNTVSTDRMFCTDEFLHGTDFYQTVLRPINVEYSLGMIVPGERHIAGCAVFRPPGAEGFGPVELELMAHLVPHVRQAIDIHREFAKLHFESASTESVLDSLSLGIAILDVTGTVLYLNEAALSICAQRDGLDYLNHRFQFSREETEEAFLALLQEAAHGEQRNQAVSIERESGRTSFSLLVAPVTRSIQASMSNLSNQTRVLVYLNNPDRDSATPVAMFCQLYKLTQVERAVLERLLEGEVVASAAKSLGISEHTLREHLKRMFAKTHTKRQAELVAKVLSSPTWILSPVFGQVS